MRATALVIAGTLMCAACAPAPPNYQPPSAAVAQAAFKSAFKADWLDRPFLVREPEGNNDSNYRVYMIYDAQKRANERAIRAYTAFRSLDIGPCVWERYRLGDIPAWSKARIVNDPKAAYRCGFKLRYQINAPYGDPKTVESEGYFFREANSYVYAGLFETPY